MKSGKLITIEGIEGAGKTTCLSAIAQQLTAHGITVCQTREPGGTPLGETLREVLLSHRYAETTAQAELLLLFAARTEHIQQRIRPTLATGHWVLCDRFTDASYAYQGAGRGLSKQQIQTLTTMVQQDLQPDLTILLDLPAHIGLQRARKRSAPDRFETETLQFFERVRAGYLALAQQEPDRIALIDATQPLNQVTQAVHQAIQTVLPKR